MDEIIELSETVVWNKVLIHIYLVEPEFSLLPNIIGIIWITKRAIGLKLLLIMGNLVWSIFPILINSFRFQYDLVM